MEHASYNVVPALTMLFWAQLYVIQESEILKDGIFDINY